MIVHSAGMATKIQIEYSYWTGENGSAGGRPPAICKSLHGLRALEDLSQVLTGCSAAWLARLTGGQKVAGSNPVTPIRPK